MRNRKDEKQNVDLEKKREYRRECFNRMLQTDEGREFFNWFNEECGFDAYNTPHNNNGELDHSKIIFNEARRTLYLQLRSFIHRDILSELEKKTTEY